MYSIRDSKSEVFNTPWFAKTHGEAERNFLALTNDQQSMVAKYPEDFDLYHVGTYDDQTGKLYPLETPQHIVKAVMVKPATAQSNVQALNA